MTLPKICPACGTSYGADSLFCPVDRTALVHGGDAAQLQGSVVADRYLLSELIGSGGMGDVYRAQDVRLQRPAAVKLLRAALTADLDALRRFRREGMNASRINSPHVVQVYDAGETSAGLPYLAMEFVPGRSLARLLADEGRLPTARVAELVRQIAAGLDAAHRLGVVHRDLKPDNILITGGAAGEEIAKVVDFGISRAIRDEGQRVTRTGFVAGTYEFMSPEQVVGGEQDQRSDLYALGLIAFLLLTGKLPFPGQTAEHSMLMRLSEPPRSLRAMCPEGDWDPRLQALFDRALARDPAERHGTAGEFASELGRAVAGSTGSATAARGTVRRGVRWAAWAGVAAALLGVLALGLQRALPLVDAHVAPAGQDSLESAELSRAPASQTDRSPSRQPEVMPDSSVERPPEERPSVDRPPVQPPPAAATDTAILPKVPTRPKPVLLPRKEPPPPAAEPALDSRALLDPFASVLHAGLPADSIGLALAALDSILPHLRTRRDTVEAEIYRAEAYALGGQEPRACAVLDGVWPRATPLQRRKIALWVDRGLCPGSDWRRS